MINSNTTTSKEKISGSDADHPETIKIWRITALWAFSESAFGGILHALKIPFSGIFISGAAVIFISLLGWYSSKKDTILKATITVILIKAIVSPYSPVTSYLAVFLQGIMGQVFFFYKRFFKTSALLLGIFAEIFSAAQKLLFLTIIYGVTLWKSVDIFFDYIISQFTSSGTTGIRYSFLAAGTYIFIHLAAGIIFGLIAGSIPSGMDSKITRVNEAYAEINAELFTRRGKSKRRWWKRPSGIVIFILSSLLIILSYITPFAGKEFGEDVIIMVIRSIFIMFLWYSVLSPLVLRVFKKYTAKKSESYSQELSKIIRFFPQFKAIISYAWDRTSGKKTFKGLRSFLITSFILLLGYEENIYPDR